MGHLAPVTLALHAGYGPRKVTIAQYDSSHADFDWLTRRLRALEPGWGGGPAIIGSPQAEGSRLDQETLLDLTIAAMDRRQGG